MKFKIWQIVFLCIMGICFVVLLINIIREKKRKLNEDFSGRITEIRYDVKGFVSVEINKKFHSIGTRRRKNMNKVKLSDSVLKYKGDPFYYITIQNGEVLKF